MRWKSAPAVSLLAGLGVALAGMNAQTVEAPSGAELAKISRRGRALAEYDQAAWHATDAVQTANPKTTEGQQSVAKKENERWTVAFGRLNAGKNRFLIGYEAEQVATTKAFAVSRNEPAREDEGFFLFAARALEIAGADFARANLPYNSAVLPAAMGQDGSQQRPLLFVYFYPAQTKAGIYPLGGDVRYLMSPDGLQIVEKRQMHRSVLDATPVKGNKALARFHTHELSDAPEDTDVLHVLQRDPPLSETITTPHFVYEVAGDGTIRIKKQKK